MRKTPMDSDTQGMSKAPMKDRRMTDRPSPMDVVASSVTPAQSLLSLTGADPGTDYGNTPMSVGNITRSWRSTDQTNVGRSPQAMIYGCFPMDAFIRGWSDATNENSSTDNFQALDVSKAANDNLFPVTEHAKYFDEDVWPVIENIFRTGVGSRATVSQSAFVRHQAMVLSIYERVYSALVLKYLTYDFDWTAVFPHSNDVPASYYKLADVNGCNPTDFIRDWMPILRRIETRTAFPYMVKWIQRNLTPMLSSGFSGRLQHPTTILSQTAAEHTQQLAQLEGYLDYIDINLTDVDGVMRSFLPYTLASADPWAMLPVTFDVNRHTGFWNSGHQSLRVFAPSGRTFDLFAQRELFIQTNGSVPNESFEARSLQAYASRHPQALWDELRCSSLYGHSHSGENNYTRLLTNVRLGYVYFFGDGDITEDFILWQGQQSDPEEPNDAWLRWRRFFESKFMTSLTLFGTRDPNYIMSSIDGSSIARMLQLETEYLWSYQMIRFLNTATSGNALRDMRSSIATLISSRTV